MGLAIDNRSGERMPRPQVTPLTPENLRALAVDWDGEPRAWPRAEQSILRAMERGSKAFLVSWTGTKTPTGVTILGQEVGNLSDGDVLGARFQQIGKYVRLVQNHGPQCNEHRVVICANPREDFAGDAVLTRHFI